MYQEVIGDLFDSDAMTLVNTVNCVGVMGKGIALEFKRRFPDMYQHCRLICQQGTLRPGQILPYRKSHPWILNFAVKDHWRHASRMEWINSCLIKFTASYKTMGITSAAFPWIGAKNGWLPFDQIRDCMRLHLSQLADIDIVVYTYSKDRHLINIV